jgi:hypothetical protein
VDLCIGASYIVSDRVLWSEYVSLWQHFKFVDSYKMWSETRPGPRDKVPDLRILGRRWLYFEANYYLSATEVHTRAAACDSGAVRLVNSGVLWMDSP